MLISLLEFCYNDNNKFFIIVFSHFCIPVWGGGYKIAKYELVRVFYNKCFGKKKNMYLVISLRAYLKCGTAVRGEGRR